MVSLGAGCSQLLSDMQAFKVRLALDKNFFTVINILNAFRMCLLQKCFIQVNFIYDDVLGCKSWLYLGRFCEMVLSS
jgi:hypothetical protein